MVHGHVVVVFTEHLPAQPAPGEHRLHGVRVALAARPMRMLVKPGMGFDEGLDIVFNEMNRTIALLQAKD